MKYAAANDKVGGNVAGLVETPAGRVGRRRRAVRGSPEPAPARGWADVLRAYARGEDQAGSR